jgi:hypothetical protein
MVVTGFFPTHFSHNSPADDQVPGLEILQGDEWMPFKPIANILFIQVGDLLQVIYSLYICLL